VLTPGDTGMLPVRGAWVTLHRIGQDSAGPVDSVRTGAHGEYEIRYRAAADDSAAWTVSTTFAGIAHFSSTFGEPDVAGDPAEIVVFDTTSAGGELHVRGRHLVVHAARAGEPRRVMEVFELENDGPKTLLARDGVVPVWRTSLPTQARGVTVDEGAFPAGTVRIERGELSLVAPITPGLRQLAIRYELPASAFPLERRLAESTEFLEVLVEDPLARVTAPGLDEVERATSEGHELRRFLARQLAANAVVRVEVPTVARARRGPVIAVLVGGTVLVLAAAFVLALRRPRDAGDPPALVGSRAST